MHGRINKSGSLEIARNPQRNYIAVICPHDSRSMHDHPVHCGIHCPLFGEPQESVQVVIKKTDIATPQENSVPGLPAGYRGEPKKGISLKLCKSDLFFETFIDAFNIIS